MRRVVQVVLFCSVLLPCTVQATPFTFLDITFFPLAANSDGKVLFRALVNHGEELSAGSRRALTFHLVVVSAGGLWEEVLEKTMGTVGMEGDGEWKRILREHETPLEWNRLSAVQKKVVREHGFKEGDEVPWDLGNGKFEWTAQGLVRKGKVISGPIRLRTLFNNPSSQADRGKPVDCSFYCRGVALFTTYRSGEGFRDEGPRWSGKDFFSTDKPDPWKVPLVDQEGVLLRVDRVQVDGICIVPKGE